MNDTGLFEPSEGAGGSVENWRSRIVGHDRIDPAELNVNPLNHRLHPEKQRDVVRDSIAEFGFVKSILVNETTGFIVDGHERFHQAMQAREKDPTILIDVEYVELSKSEEAAVLAILDASTDMAEIDPDKLDALLREVNTESQAIADMLSDLSKKSGVFDLDDLDEVSIPDVFSLVVECEDDDQQQELFERLEAEGYKCRPLNL